MSKGFTLIELLVVMVIIGILTAIAVPNYSAYVTRSRIQDATSQLADLRTKMEQYYQDNRHYGIGGTCASPDGSASSARVKTAFASDYFTFSCATTGDPATAYTLTATGTSGKPMAGFTFTVNEANARRTTAVPSSDWGTAPFACWIQKPGAC